MKLEIGGIVDKIHGIEPLRKGFQQRVILHQPEQTVDVGGRDVTYKEEYFVITIYSKEQTDKRFLTPKNLRSKIKASVYLKGERWFNDKTKDFNYAHKLNLNQWI